MGLGDKEITADRGKNSFIRKVWAEVSRNQVFSLRGSRGMEEVEVTGEDKCSPNLDSEGRRERGKREERKKEKE